MNVHRVPPAWQLPEGRQRPPLAIRPHAAAGRRGRRLLRGQPAVPGRRPGPRRTIHRSGTARGPGLRGRVVTRCASPRRGFRVAAVDLSRPMLEMVGRKAASEGVERAAGRVQPLPPGLLPRRDLRLRAVDVQHARHDPRAARPGVGRWPRPAGSSAREAGSLSTLTTSGSTSAIRQGRAWLLQQASRALFAREDLGERRMTYRGIPGMRVHLYRWGELKRRATTAPASGSTRSCRSTR